VRFMRRKSQHDQITILTKHAMCGVWVVILSLLLPTDEIHDFVLTLAWYIGARENYGQIFPSGIAVKLAFDKVLKMLRAAFKKWCPRRDRIGMKRGKCFSILFTSIIIFNGFEESTLKC
jgi:hypothetical protein